MTVNNEKSKIVLSHVEGLSQLIELRNNDLLRNTKIELIVLYWKIGKIVFEQIEIDRELKSKQLMVNLSERLIANYGNLLSKQNLKKMMLFAKHFPDISLVQQISTLLSWQHITKLLKIESLELKWYYIELAIREGLSPTELGKVIETKSLNKTLLSKGSLKWQNEDWYTEMMMICIDQPTLNNQMFKDFIKFYRSEDFRKLLKRSLSTATFIKLNEEEDKLLYTLFKEVKIFQKTHNYWLNATLNRSFREVGNYLKEYVYLKKQKDQEDNLIEKVSKILSLKYGSNFNYDQLMAMMCFSNNVLDRVSYRISSLVAWEHLLIIMLLKEPEEQLFYARVAAKEVLNADTLRQWISENIYQSTSGAEETEKQTLNVLNNPQVIVKNIKNRKQQIVMTEYLVDLGSDTEESKAVVDIFQNQYFPFINKIK